MCIYTVYTVYTQNKKNTVTQGCVVVEITQPPNKPPIINSTIQSRPRFLGRRGGMASQTLSTGAEAKMHRFKFRWFVATNPLAGRNEKIEEKTHFKKTPQDKHPIC